SSGSGSNRSESRPRPESGAAQRRTRAERRGQGVYGSVRPWSERSIISDFREIHNDFAWRASVSERGSSPQALPRTSFRLAEKLHLMGLAERRGDDSATRQLSHEIRGCTSGDIHTARLGGLDVREQRGSIGAVTTSRRDDANRIEPLDRPRRKQHIAAPEHTAIAASARQAHTQSRV